MYGSERPMGPVPCIAVKGLWDRSHAWLLDKHGTGPIGQLGLHIMTCKLTEINFALYMQLCTISLLVLYSEWQPIFLVSIPIFQKSIFLPVCFGPICFLSISFWPTQNNVVGKEEGDALVCSL